MLKIEELDRKPSSCPYLYTWNGERFEFITDFLGGGEMGYWLAPGMRNTPDPDEYVRIDADRLRPRNGRYELRITNELEESLFLDRVQLVAVAHPRDVTVHPNEGLVPEPRPFTLYSSRGPRSRLSPRATTRAATCSTASCASTADTLTGSLWSAFAATPASTRSR